ncbi:3-deoxy-D-manno-octulosonic-acid transferase [Ketogulonicigenium robustum]|uniref:3-deoxy-D-manno-octulosonic acid transferase n=1 Tax=Ketogulonicigenium robustum TaxID=92947 RepID=A0A1W6P0I8_9RHOB|nr:glycosyltransferase N-terminal domain-containing protein [Ketogulonicigenium robustum]ARO14787.1 3-deoxy-D-manno-octulosonic-acid transferase [Ketogulonicigenium robustum]
MSGPTIPLRLYGWLAPRLIARRLPALQERMAGAGLAPRAPEREGITTIPRPAGRTVWLHGASVGEGLALLDLAKGLRDAAPDLTCVLTTGTIGGAEVIAPRLTTGIIHQFAPLDDPRFVTRFLDHWQPSLCVLTESEIWPNTLQALRARGISAALVNARLSEKSLKLWARLPKTAAQLFGTFAFIHCQDDNTRQALHALAPTVPLRVGQNLKAAAAPLPADPARLQSLRDAIGTRPVWIAASTHAGEDEVLLDAHRTLLQTDPDLLMILAPRHPERAPQILPLMADLRIAQRSTGALPTSDTQVYLADTFGETGLWYRLADVGFLAGSLLPQIGGHNPWEGAALGLPQLSGPYVQNAAADYAALTAAGALWQVQGDIAPHLSRLLGDADARAQASAAALAAAASQGTQRADVLHDLLALLPERNAA